MRALKLPAEHGYFAVASSAIDFAEANGEIKPNDLKFLTDEFKGALDRVNSIASTIGTAGSFLLALVAVAVSLTTGLHDKTGAVTKAADATAQLAQGCLPANASPACTKIQLDHAVRDVNSAQQALTQTSTLTTWQAIAAFLILLAFLAALLSQLINPVMTPAAKGGHPSGISDWRRILNRYEAKRALVLLSFCLQTAAAAFIVVIALTVL